jgi:hypothetical protein
MSTQPLTLARYRAICCALPRPSEKGIEDFALFVSQAHSWYKRTTLLPPGMPLYFFIDPSAGMQRIVRLNGRVLAVAREKPGFHHSWLPTAQYRARFGCLAFCDNSGGGVELHPAQGDVQIGSDTDPVVMDPSDNRLRDLPRSILRAGQACISGVVHVAGASYPWWNIVFEQDVGCATCTTAGGMPPAKTRASLTTALRTTILTLTSRQAHIRNARTRLRTPKDVSR